MYSKKVIFLNGIALVEKRVLLFMGYTILLKNDITIVSLE